MTSATLVPGMSPLTFAAITPTPLPASVFLLLPKTSISDGDRTGLSGVSQGVRAAQNVCGAASLVYPGTQPNPLASSSPNSHTVQPLTCSHGIS